MKKCFSLHGVLLTCCSALLLVGLGCDQDAANEAMQEVETSAGDAAGALTDDAKAAMEKGKEMAGEAAAKGKEMAGDAAAKGKEMASELGENAMAFLAPLKEKLGNLDSLKETPEKLKTAVTELIASMEQKTEGFKLPEAMSQTLATVKEKLVALRDYLEGEYEQAKIDEKVQDIVDAMKSGFGMTSN